MSQNIDVDLLIVGGGVAGSALAAALRNSEYRIAMIDQRTAPLDTARGDHFFPYNVAAFAEWGILDGLFAAGATKRIGHEFRTSTGEVLIQAEYTEIGIPHPYFVVLNHDKMAETFQSFAKENSNFELFQPYTVKDFTFNGSASEPGIEIVIADGPDGRVTFSAPLVIATDGASSPIRTALKFPTFEHPYRHPMVAFFAKRPKDLNPENYFFRYSSPDGVLVVQQRTDGQIKITQPVGDEGIPWWKKSTSEQRAEHLSKRANVLHDIDTEIAGFYPVRMIHSLQYVSNNTVLIGDAAHAIHPARGQGLNMGIAALPEFLKHLPTKAELRSPEKVRKALKAFESIQKPAYERVIARNHAAAMSMEASVEENHEFLIKREDEGIRKMAEIPQARVQHLLESTGYPFGVN